MRKMYRNYIGLFYFSFFALGALEPLLSQYLKSIKLSGTQIGIIVSLTSLISILIQPFWGSLCDKTQKNKKILLFLILVTASISLFVPLFKSYYIVIIVFIIFYFFLSGIIPIIETMAVNSSFGYGNIRQWGSIGFAIAVLIAGFIADKYGLFWIFIIFSISYLVTIPFIKPIEIKKFPKTGGQLKGIGSLFKNHKYVLFLISTFFISGAIAGHNTYFGILYEYLGGTITGIGVAFLLFAGSEAPFMKLTFIWIKKIGIESMLIFSAVISMIRFFWYSTNPSPTLVIAFFILQGLSIGTYLVSAAEFIRQNTKEELRGTAMSIYASISMGFGGMISKFTGGIILDHLGISTVYLFLAIFTIIGLIPITIIKTRKIA